MTDLSKDYRLRQLRMGVLTYGCVGGHVVAVVEADEGEIGDVGGEGQDEENADDAGHAGPPQTQRPGQHTP